MDKEPAATVSAKCREPMEETFLDPGEWDNLDPVAKEGFTVHDQQDMNRMGKQQQFRRNFRFITTVGFTCCVMGTWEILMTSNTQALLAGGSAALFWSLCWCYVGQTFIVLSLAEMSSMARKSTTHNPWERQLTMHFLLTQPPQEDSIVGADLIERRR